MKIKPNRETDVLPRLLAPARAQGHPAAGSGAPARPDEIPGLGPIRVRALNKVGLNTVEALKTATPETLAAVPGITPIKARYISDYLAPFSLQQIRAAALAGSASRSAGLVQWDAQSPPVSISPAALEAARALGAAVRILTSPHGTILRNRLVAALERFGQECQGVIVESVPVEQEDVEAHLRRLRKATDTLNDAARKQAFDKKDQGRAAEELLDIAAWLAGCRAAYAASRNSMGATGEQPKRR